MKEASRTWIALVILALIIGTLYVVLDSRSPEGPVNPAEYVWELAMDQILSIRVVDLETGTATAVERADFRSAWQITEPISAQADPAKMTSLVYGVVTLRIRYSIPEPEESEMEAYGLTAPSYMIEAQIDDGRILRLEVGNRYPTGLFYTRQVGEQAVLLVEDNDVDALLPFIESPPAFDPTMEPPESEEDS